MDLKRLTWHEFVAMAGAVILAIGLFLPWYHAENQRAEIAGTTGPGDFTGWEVHTTIRYLLLAAAAAPIILSYIVARGHALSWPRGEMTAVIAIACFGLVGYNGLIDRPGDPAGLISTKFGLYIALLGIILMMAGSALRASESERPRKPPGVL
jgi:hypothetical protein